MEITTNRPPHEKPVAFEYLSDYGFAAICPFCGKPAVLEATCDEGRKFCCERDACKDRAAAFARAFAA